MNRRTLAIIAASVAAFICCACISIIVWIEISDRADPAAATALRQTFTAEAAVEQATQAAANTQATADIARITNQQLVFEETFDADPPALDMRCFDRIEEGEAYASYTSNRSCFTLTGHTVSDFAAQVQCDVTGDNGECGLVFSAVQNAEGNVISYYAVYVTDDTCRFTRVPPEGLSYSGGFRCDSWIYGLTQLLRVERVRHRLRIFIDNELVDEFNIDEPDMLSGDVGLIVGRGSVEDEPSSAYIYVDNFKLWEIP